jgi:uncharacterized repeat protein (TIGR01451 family)
MRWFIGVLVLLLAALLLESGLLAYAMYVLLGLLLFSRYLARSWIRNLEAVRHPTEPTAEIGEVVKVSITIRNRGLLPVPWVLLEDLLPASALAVENPRLKIKGQRIQLRMLWGRSEGKLQYQIRPQMRGYYQLGPLVMETGDLFGLHRRNIVCGPARDLLVYPRTVPLQGYDLASRRPIGEIQISHRLFEDPTRISGVREYQAGDPLARVHWRATARTGQLHCKIYEPSTLSGATILLDFHESGYPSRVEPLRSELAATAANSLAYAVTEVGQQVGLVTNGRDAVDRVRREQKEGIFENRGSARDQAMMKDRSERLRPLVVETRSGIEQFQRMREAIARLELTDGLTLDGLVCESASRLARDATIIALLPAVSAETALALGSLRRQGYAVTAVLVMPGDDDREQFFARLLAEGVLDVRELNSEAELPALCQKQVERSAPYAFAVSY